MGSQLFLCFKKWSTCNVYFWIKINLPSFSVAFLVFHLHFCPNISADSQKFTVDRVSTVSNRQDQQKWGKNVNKRGGMLHRKKVNWLLFKNKRYLCVNCLLPRTKFAFPWYIHTYIHTYVYCKSQSQY